MRKIFVLTLALMWATFAAPAAFATCEGQYFARAEPRVIAAISVRELCYDEFAVGHSADTHTPLWSAEHLTAVEVDAARTLARRDFFHAETRLPRQERAELADYVHSGFDRGHLAPSGDMPNARAQAQSFTLANMTPQAPALNRGVWEAIEVAVRDLAETDGDLYVVTGPVFSGNERYLRGRVRVPNAMFKAIYDPRRRAAGAYVADNRAGGDYRVVSIADLTALIGVDVFPTLPGPIKARAMDLPEPERRRHGESDESVAIRRPTGILTALNR